MSKVNLLKQSFSPSVHMMQHTGVGGRGADHHKSSAEGKACLIPRRRTMDIKAASRVGSGRAHPGPLAPDYIMHGSVVCCSDRSDLSLGENLCVFRSAKFCSDPGRSAKFTANIQDLNISDPVIIGCYGAAHRRGPSRGRRPESLYAKLNQMPLRHFVRLR